MSPYITPGSREGLSPQTDDYAQSPGELNFQFTMLAKDYIERRGLTYSTLNEVIGVFVCAMLETYRRVVAPYEDKKIEENGDVWGWG